MTRDINSVSDALISRCRERGLSVSNLMLQKLLYYSQAWHLALGNAPLFEDEIEAWVHGPVVPLVFRRFKVYKWDPITERVPTCSDASLIQFLDSIISLYGKYSAKDLERLTHNEAPWTNARVGLSPDEPSSKVIPKEDIRSYFRGLMPARG